MGTSRFKSMLLGAPMLLMLLVLSACGSTNNQPASGGTGTTTTAPKYQVGLVTDTGGLNDRGFNQLAHTGYEMAEQKYHFRDSIVQSPNTNPDYKAELTQAAQSNDLVIGVGFLMAQAIDEVAKMFPNKYFALVDSCAAIDANGDCDTNIKNVTPLLFKEQEAGCLVGVVAGQMEKDGKAEASKLLGANTIGAVGGISIPPVDHYIAGYKYCAQQVDPNVKILVQYSNDFNDPTKCQAPADAMIRQKMADIIFQVAGGCGVGALDAAAADGVYGIGVDTDQGYLHPDSIITSATKHVDTAVYDIIDLTEQGKYPSDPNNFPRFDLKGGGVGAAPLSSLVPSDVQPVLTMYMNEIEQGTINIPDSCAPAQTCATS
jgi:basic membrane protein A